ncbi:MAG TPA: hypothetical protein VIK86_07515 [Candidatus Paceibacterota bacterium]
MKNITFLNTCSVQDWASVKDKEFRLNANNYISSVINQSSFLSKFNDISVEFYQEGVSSIVVKLLLLNGIKYVLKTSSRNKILKSEIISLKKWKEVEVTVPNIYEEGDQDQSSYYIMDYFDGLTLKNKIDDNSIKIEEVGQIMGTALYKTQNVSGAGFGFPFIEKDMELIGPIPLLKDYLETEFVNSNKFDVVSKEFPETEWRNLADFHAGIILKENNTTFSVLGNMDFSPRHFFATENPTMFDPFPELIPEYFDVAFYLIPERGTSEGIHYEIRKSTLDSYLSLKGKINNSLLCSALWLLTYRKSANLLNQPDDIRSERARYMLSIISTEKSMNGYLKLYSLIN